MTPLLSSDLGVVIRLKLQIEDIKINRHHKFLVHIFNWSIGLYLLHKKVIKVHLLIKIFHFLFL